MNGNPSGMKRMAGLGWMVRLMISTLWLLFYPLQANMDRIRLSPSGCTLWGVSSLLGSIRTMGAAEMVLLAVAKSSVTWNTLA